MFCNYPFAGMDVTQNGNVYVCCADWLPIPIGNIFETPLTDIWTGKMATDLRISILDQSFRFCGPSCPFLSKPRGPVSLEKISSPPPLEWVKELRLSYDPTCNLKCPSCRAAPIGSDTNTKLIHQKVIESNNLQKTKLLYVTGYGDPVASNYYWPLLCNLENLPTNPNLIVRLHTNGLLLTPEKWKELGKNSAKIVNIAVSIDAACENTYNLNRGGSWQRLHDNLAFISKLPGIRLEMNFVVQANNFKEMPDFVRMAFRYSAQFIFFAGIRNWRAPQRYNDTQLLFSDLEYQARAVHLPSHPQHAQLIKILQNPVLNDPRILLADFLS